MGAITNGIALDGTLRPYCGTFLIFSDYMRPSIRLAALMRIPSIFVFTHDSIFLGEDGPTHQPIEQLDSLRAIPGLRVFRPADGIETALAWAWIAAHRDGPALLALSRQTVKALVRPAGFEPAALGRGAYVVEDPAGSADVVLVATGSEVSLSVEAAAQLRGDGIAARVVSLPCLELFLEQSEEFRNSVIPDDGTPIVAVEAARGETQGLFAGMERSLQDLGKMREDQPSELGRKVSTLWNGLIERVQAAEAAGPAGARISKAIAATTATRSIAVL